MRSHEFVSGIVIMALATVAVACAKPDDRGERAARAGASSASVPPAGTASTAEQWERIDYNATTVDSVALAPLPLAEVQRIRAIIFGRHGRIFQDSTLQRWLETRPWYHADTAFTNARLTQRERENLEVVRQAEAIKHPQIESGDMRFYQNRVVTTAMLGQHSADDWEVLEAEVLANHGFIFSYEEDPARENRSLQGDGLQKYFEDRYWYHADPDFEASELSPIERQNLDTIALAVMRQNKRSVSPGMMHLFRATPLTDTMLAGISIADLRLLRNEVYARHGRIFQTKWLAEEFRQYPWYTPRPDYSDAQLSPIEKANIALIARREQMLHESLSTRLLDVADVRGLRHEDARRLRNEIYARHGRRFRDPTLRRYFESFAWYKPNPGFREEMLNPTEKANALLISRYEDGRFTEG